MNFYVQILTKIVYDLSNGAFWTSVTKKARVDKTIFSLVLGYSMNLIKRGIGPLKYVPFLFKSISLLLMASLITNTPNPNGKFFAPDGNIFEKIA